MPHGTFILLCYVIAETILIQLVCVGGGGVLSSFTFAFVCVCFVAVVVFIAYLIVFGVTLFRRNVP